MTSVHLPDICSLCLGPGFCMRINRNCRIVCVSSQKWTERNSYLCDDDLQMLPGLNVGLLCSLCLPTADVAPLTIIANMLTLLLYEKGNQSEDREHPAFVEMWKQLSRTTSSSWQDRFRHDLGTRRTARDSVSEANQLMVMPSLEEYIEVRREASGVMLAFDLLEFAEGLNLPDEAFYHPIIHCLRQDAVDILAWSSDLASYCQDYYHGRTHNIISVLMDEYGITAQAAIDHTSRLIQQKVKSFSENMHSIPQFPGSDDDVRIYIHGLRDWIVGYAYWIYETDRYFDDRGEEVKLYGWVFLRDQEFDPKGMD